MQKKITDYLPELFIVVSPSGAYLDFFGGADSSRYQNVDSIKGCSLRDFFDRKTTEKIVKTIEMAINKNVTSEVEYKIDTAGDLKDQHYRASLSPVLDDTLYGQECVIMSIQNITREIDTYYQACKVTPFDTTLPITNVFNLVALDDALMELDNRSQSRSAAIKVEFEYLELIQSVCSKEIKDNLEVTIIKTLQNAIKFTDHVLGRASFGSYWIGASVGESALVDVVKKAIEVTADKVVTSRNPDVRISTAMSIEIV